VTRVEVKTDAARALRPVGAVAEIVVAPADALHSYRVRFLFAKDVLLFGSEIVLTEDGDRPGSIQHRFLAFSGTSASPWPVVQAASSPRAVNPAV
jgi:hypothetical protein